MTKEHKIKIGNEEVNLLQLERFDTIRRHHLHLFWDQAVTESEGCRGKFIVDPAIRIAILTWVFQKVCLILFYIQHSIF